MNQVNETNQKPNCWNCGHTDYTLMEKGEPCNLCLYTREDMCEYCGGCTRENYPIPADACSCDGEDDDNLAFEHRRYFGE